VSSGAWIELQIELAAPAAELVAAELSDTLGGVELRDSETVFPTARDRAAVVALCRPDDLEAVLASVQAVLDTARSAGGEVDPVTVRQRPAHEDEWRDVWKQFFRSTQIGRHFVVRPSWEEGLPPSAAHVIHLDPGRAFGTGAHPSTKLVIAAIEDLADQRVPVGRFLDLGCGSGILTIAARRLWPGAAGVAADLDEEAVACAGENLALNQVTDIATVQGSLDSLDAAGSGGPFDLIMANIQRDVLEELAPAFRPRLAAAGWLVLSGLLTSDVGPVRARFEQVGFRFRTGAEDGGWGSLILTPQPG
jgi:ribosomal protein L11 methyltransferase